MRHGAGTARRGAARACAQLLLSADYASPRTRCSYRSSRPLPTGDFYPDSAPGVVSVAFAKSDTTCAGDFPIFAVQTTAFQNTCITLSPTLAMYGTCMFTKVRVVA